MRVAFDEQIFLMQRDGGISRSFIELINALDSHADLAVTAIPPPGATACRAAASAWQVPEIRSSLRRHATLAAARSRNRGLAPHDVVHRTFYDPAWLSRTSMAPMVVTVHDMIPELMPEAAPPGVHMAKREYVERADLILTNSQCTRRDLITTYGEPHAPVVVTPFGVSLPPPGPVRLPTTPTDYVIYVGPRGGYKSFDILVGALALLPRTLHVLAVGGGAWRRPEIALQRSLAVTQRITRMDLTDTQLATAYRHALCLAVPSRYEGFGLPVLEAMSVGTPVVASAAGALPEVGGDAAQYVVPGDPAALAHRIEALWRDADLRRSQTEAGIQRSAQFTWAHTARRTAAAYHELLAS